MLKNTFEQDSAQLWRKYTTLDAPDDQEKFWQTYQSIVDENKTNFLLQKTYKPKTRLSSNAVTQLEVVYNPAYRVYHLLGWGVFIAIIPILASIQFDRGFGFVWLIFSGLFYSKVIDKINTVEVYSSHLCINSKWAMNQLVVPWKKLQYVTLKSKANLLCKFQILTLTTTDKTYEVLLFLPMRDVDELREKLTQKGFSL
ncbi:hypothetical protein BKI52_00940 [marine bacterium AO1-C]|nr:hypothetical protein BKI52_00940 [marine bacterium AO1-C]